MPAEAPFLEAQRRIDEVRRSGGAKLDLSDLGLERVPEEIGRISGLTAVDLSVNQLATLPESIGHLAGLRSLDLSGNRLSALPESIGHLAELELLDLRGNRLVTLPESLGKLGWLEVLDLSVNQLVRLPESLGRLRGLRKLYLFHNRLTTLPESLGGLTGLQRLYLFDNRLTALPESLARLQELEELYLHENPGLDMPPEVLGPDRQAVQKDRYSGKRPRSRLQPADPKDILRYYFQRQRQPRRRLNEAKLLVVGQGGVGKTSLVRRLIRDEFDPEEAKTEGIAIEPWMIDPPEGLRRGPAGERVRLNVWDFGGQEIMHATHQFFLTRRSLYLLVLDARKGENEGNVRYWLKIIQSYGADSPVLVVVNKAESHHLELDERRLAKDYAPNLRGFFKVSCAEGTGIDALRGAIVRESCGLPHVFDELPERYFKVKESLIKRARSSDFIDYAQYERICGRHRLTDRRDRDLLLRFLHDLGNVLNFDDPEDPYELRDTNILNPEWVTGGVYRLINSARLAGQQGRLEWGQIAGILNDPVRYPADRHRFLIEMMRKFELCFDFADAPNRRWLIPELLPRNEPDLPDLDDPKALKFQYHYNVLPGGLICRFIVRMHRYLSPDRPTYWRSGVLLGVDGCRALVRGDSDSGRVFVSVLGPERRRRAALAVVRDAFRAIHATIPRLEAEEKVPMPDDPRVVVGYRHLLKLEELGERTYLPEGAGRKYDVADLLEGVTTAGDREADRMRSGDVRGAYIAHVEQFIMSEPGKNVSNKNIKVSHVSGSTINFGELSGRVSNTINQMPEVTGPGGEDAKGLLAELKAIIERAKAEGVGEQTASDALSEVEEVAEGAKEEEATGRVARALRNLRRMAPDFKAFPMIAEQFGKLVDELGKIWA
ncbi:COR domain-containing protein [Tautonia plasticadhaerens]|uniref:non-specific serine/threonine protein kinase n=1 Tax=Tautonia plasticadhaerens TaxID=2527974 RepID=A0A518HD00_9BACT|nr:COR domain-containing protein [Tautonia plasticadhaerens]QDV38731.1 E3 ubiquitin-protein ligase SlrP [Tautonia plasticadhaerens]